MFPELFHLGPITVHSYGAMLALGFLGGAWLLRRQLRRVALPEDLADRVAIAGMAGGIVGAKLYFIIVEAPEDFAREPITMLFSGAGLTFYGGLLGAILLIWWVVRRAKVPVLVVADLIGPILVLGYACGRGGCFLSGDGDYGPPTDLPWGMSFPNGTVPTTIPVHPTPLYEIALCLVGFSILWFWLRKKSLPTGVMTGATLVVVGIERFVTEFWRLDSGVLASWLFHYNVLGTPQEHSAFDAAVAAHYSHGGLSIAQWISLGLILLGGVILFLRRKATGTPAKQERVPAGRA